jgi:hypothetical protein
MIGETTRFMSVTIKFKTLGKTSKKKIKCKNHNLVLIPYYAPHSGYPEEEIEKATQEFSEFLSKIPLKNTTTIIGADINASIGTRNTIDPSNREEDDDEFESQDDTISQLLSPHGNPHRNENRERILNLLKEHDLRAASTFFGCNNKCNTWRNPRDKCPYQIDRLLIPRNQLCHTINVKRKLDSIDRDHAVLCIMFQTSNETVLHKKRDRGGTHKPKTKINNFILRNSQKNRFQEKVSKFFRDLEPRIAIESSDDEVIQLFLKATS